jgi:hypothetical protein
LLAGKTILYDSHYLVAVFLQKKNKKNFFFIFITYSFSKTIQKFDDFIKEG